MKTKKLMEMKTTKIVMLMTLGAILFNSCAKDNTNLPNNKGVAVKFSSTLGNNLKTASLGDSTTTWLNTDQIGIYMVNDGTPLSANNIVLGADNIPYTANPQSNATSADFKPQSDPIYYPVDASQQVNFVAYYPYSANQTGNFSYRINLKDQSASTSQAVNDLLYANNSIAYNKQSGNVDLQFQHVLAKMVIQIIPGNGLTAADLDGLKVTINGFQVFGVFDLASHTLSMTNPFPNPLDAYTSPDGSLAQAILLPQLALNLTVDFQLTNGETFTWKLNPTLTPIEAANLYKYKVTINKTGITATGTIASWRNVIAGGGVAE